ncbi:MAG: autotransporter domain-containing protein [Hyphomonadaceae bacterium]
MQLGKGRVRAATRAPRLRFAVPADARPAAGLRALLWRVSQLALLAALAPLAAMGRAQAQTTISDARTVPFSTSTAGDISIQSTGSITLTSPGAAVTVDSSNTVTNSGAIQFNNVSNAIGIHALGGVTSAISNANAITLLEDYVATDSDGDGDLDGAFASGGNRFGILLDGAGTFTGDIASSGAITVEGSDSGGIVLQSPLAGSLSTSGAIAVVGDRGYGVRVQAPVSGAVSIMGSTIATGQNSVGISIEAPVTGQLHLQNSVTATGYRYVARPSAAAIAKLDADDLLQGGGGVSVQANIGGGVLLDAPPADADPNNADEDGDGLTDSGEPTAAIVAYGGAPALRVGQAASPSITLGIVAAGDPYGLVNRGAVTASGVYDGVAAQALRIDNALVTGGMRNAGSISSQSFNADATALGLGSGANLATLLNTGSITATMTGDGAGAVRALSVEAGASLASITNSGAISGVVNGEDADITVIRDLSNTLHLIENSGTITARHVATDDVTDADDADTDIANEVIRGKAVAIDFSGQTTASTIRQTGTSSSITGDILFGSGADLLDVQGGAVTGALAFGAGADSLSISGGATVTGAVSDSDGALAVAIGAGTLDLRNAGVLTLSSLDLAFGAVLSQRLDPANNANGSLTVTGAANLAAGSTLSVNLVSLVPTQQTFRLLTAGAINGTNDVAILNQPFLYASTTTRTATTIDIEMRRKSAAELGLTARQTLAYEPAIAALQTDGPLSAAILGLSTQSSFTAGFNQLTPDITGGEVALTQSRVQTMQAHAFDRLSHADAEPDRAYLWIEELGYAANRDPDGIDLGYKSWGLGVAFGADRNIGKSSAVGVGAAFSSGEVDPRSSGDNEVTATSYELFAHAGTDMGAVRAGLWLGGGYDEYESKRLLSITPNAGGAAAVSRTIEGAWNGWHAAGALLVDAPMDLGALKLRPELSVNALRASEDAYVEAGGGAANLSVDQREMTAANAAAILALGLPFEFSETTVTPEFLAGFRQRITDDPLETTLRYAAGGGDFTLVSDPLADSAAVVGFSLRASGTYASFRLEGAADISDGGVSASGRLAGRLLF